MKFFAVILSLTIAFTLLSIVEVSADYCTGIATRGTVACPNPDAQNNCANWYCENIQPNTSVNCNIQGSRASCEAAGAPSGGQQKQGAPVNCLGCHWVVTSVPPPPPPPDEPPPPGPGGCGNMNCNFGCTGSAQDGRECIPNSGCPGGWACRDNNCTSCSGGGGSGGQPSSCAGQPQPTNCCGGLVCNGGRWGPVCDQQHWDWGTCPCGFIGCLYNDPGWDCQGGYSSPPSSPSLTSPGYGETISGLTANLQWSHNGNFGTACGGNNNTYRIFVSTNYPPNSQVASVNSGTSSYNFTGQNNTFYYWKVASHNGSSSADSSVSVFYLSLRPWWKVFGGGVTAGGSVGSLIPTGDRFMVDPAGVIMAGNGTADFNNQTASSTNWVVANENSDLASSVVLNNGYDDVERNILGYLTPTTVSTPIASINQLLTGTPVNGVYYLMAEGDLDLAQGGALDLGTNKVVLLVRGNVTIHNSINLTDNQGFFMLASSGDIALDSSVGTMTPVDPTTLTPHLEGIFLAGNVFSTGSGDRQVRIDGSVSGMGGVVFERDLSSTYPGESFFFRPEMAVFSPKETLKRNLVWEEVAP